MIEEQLLYPALHHINFNQNHAKKMNVVPGTASTAAQTSTLPKLQLPH